MKNIPLQSLQLFCIIELRADIATTFGSKIVTISTRNTKTQKICELRKATLSVFYNISRPNFAILLLLLKGSFQEFCFLSGFAQKISLLFKLFICRIEREIKQSFSKAVFHIAVALTARVKRPILISWKISRAGTPRKLNVVQLPSVSARTKADRKHSD